MKPKISLLTLGVKNLDESLNFYRDILNFPLHNYQPDDDNIMFKLDGTWLALYSKEKLAEDATIDPSGSGFAGFTFAHNLESKEQVDDLIHDFREKGVKIVKEPQEVFWGGYSSYFADPDGYLWEVAYNPFTDLT
ncbi:MAG: VOC family protein [Bacteroidota bacterium]